MAGEGVVGVLKAVLGLDTAQFEDGTRRAAKSMNDFGTQMKAVFAGVGLERIVERVFDAMVHAFKETIVHAFKFADEMGKMAQKVGISVEELTGLKLAADLADVPIEVLSKSLGILFKNMVAAASGNKEMANSFAQLGISVRDSVTGEIKSVIQVLTEIADKFGDTKDGAVKVDAALKLLGRGGKELIPLLNEGGTSLKTFAEVAERMGLVVSTKTAAQTQKFNDDLKILKLAMEGVANIVVSQLIGGFVKVSSQMADTAKKGEGIRDVARQIVSAFKEVVFWTIAVYQANQILGQAHDEAKEAVGGYGAEANKVLRGTAPLFVLLADKFNELLGLNKKVTDSNKDVGGSVKDVITSYDETGISFLQAGDQAVISAGKFQKPIDTLSKFKTLGAEIKELLKGFWEGVDVHVKELGKSVDDPVNKNMEKFNDHIKNLRMQALDTSGVFAGKLAPGFLAAASGMEALKGQITIVRDRMVVLGPQAQELNIEMAKFAAIKLTAENLDPLTAYAQKMEQIVFLQREAGLSAQTAAILQVKAAGDVLTAYGTAAQNIVGGFASAFKDLASMNKKYAGAAKALAIGEALVQTYLGAVKAYTSTVGVLGPIGAAVAAAAATAAGLANVAKISATNFATGGSFKVGGAGGIDSQVISMRLTPGEMVDVRKPGQGRMEGGGGVQTIELRSPRMRDFFTEHVRDLVAVLNQAAPDGYVLKVT